MQEDPRSSSLFNSKICVYVCCFVPCRQPCGIGKRDAHWLSADLRFCLPLLACCILPPCGGAKSGADAGISLLCPFRLPPQSLKSLDWLILLYCHT